MNLKIDKRLRNDLNEIAENEFCPVETIIKRGLKIFIDYYEHKDISEYLKATIPTFSKGCELCDNN